VARDFVELPSQLYEHWLEVPEVLANTPPMPRPASRCPQDMLDRLLAAQTFDMGFQTVEYVASALVDLDFHDGAAPADPMAAQAEVLERIGMPRAIGMRHATPHFAHVFAGDGYSSGLLQLHVVRGDGCRRLRRLRGGGRCRSIPRAPKIAEPDPHMGGAKRNCALKIAAHPHGKAAQSIAFGDLRKKAKCRLGSSLAGGMHIRPFTGRSIAMQS
jgi:hypothetical protein